ncbi:Hypothetical protein CINCED_3A010588 [Cinara cedri]|uniref:Uncharacterized protein n=1 Tax=Cinara cedri TaxID=506608 RepID=A0A5E4M702_9HEMI|nr:Hypothetical protein CINCED_3A010588 [Cinara cedri]
MPRQINGGNYVTANCNPFSKYTERNLKNTRLSKHGLLVRKVIEENPVWRRPLGRPLWLTMAKSVPGSRNSIKEERRDICITPSPSSEKTDQSDSCTEGPVMRTNVQIIQ